MGSLPRVGGYPFVKHPAQCLTPEGAQIGNITARVRIAIACVWPMWIYTLLCFLRPIKMT